MIKTFFNGLTPDNTSWAVLNVIVTPLTKSIRIRWTNPTAPTFSYALVVRKIGGFSEGKGDPKNVVIYSGTDEEIIDTSADLAPLVTYYYTVYGINTALTGVEDPTKWLYTADNDLGATTPLKTAYGPYPHREPALTPPVIGGNYRGTTNAYLGVTIGVPSPQKDWAWNFDNNSGGVIVKDYGFTEIIYGEAE